MPRPSITRAARPFAAVAIVWILVFLAAAPSGRAQPVTREIGLDCGGWFSGFAVHSSGRLYGFGDIFGAYRSDDGGESWSFIQKDFTEMAFFIIAMGVSPVDADRVAFNNYGGLWTSTDGGASWTKRLGDLAFAKRTRGSAPIAWHPTNLNELWLAAPRTGSSDTLWRSTDGGANWSPVGGSVFQTERVTTVHFLPGAPSEVWAGTVGGLWCSTDAGATWRKVWNNNGQNSAFGTPQVNSIARNASRVSVIATNDGVWQISAGNWADTATYSATQRLWDQINVPCVVALADGSFYATEIGDQSFAPRVSANGSTWTERAASLTTAYVPVWTTAAAIAAKPRPYGRDQVVQSPLDPTRWFMTGGAAPSISTDSGSTWRYAPSGLSGVATYRVRFDRTEPLRAYISASDIGAAVVTDGGFGGQAAYSSNKFVQALHTYHEILASANGQTLIGAGVNQETNSNAIVRSTDGGLTWSQLPLGGAGLPASTEGIVRAAMSPTDPADFIVITGYSENSGATNNPGVYRTTNGGVSFVKATGIPDGINTGGRYGPTCFIEADGVTAGVRYAVFRAANLATARGLWLSTDGGSSWTKRSDPFSGDWTFDFAVDPTQAGRLWAGSDYRGLRTSPDGGLSWSAITGFTKAVAVDAYAGRVAVRGRRSGDTWDKIYYSADQGVNWQEMTGPNARLAWAGGVAVDPWRAGQIWVTGSRSVTVINPPASLSGPRISASAPAPHFALAPGASALAPVVVSNTGSAPLTWNATPPPPSAGNPALADSATPGSGVSYSWIDAVTGGTRITAFDNNRDDYTTDPIPLPFTFPYYGNAYSSVRVCSNGFLNFTETETPYNPTASLPDGSAPRNILALFWTDLYVRSDSSIHYRSPDSSTFVVSYVNMSTYGNRNDAGAPRINAQVVLKSNGQIIYQYQSVNSSLSGFTIGMQNQARTFGVTAGPFAASSLQNRALRFTPPPHWLTNLSPASGTLAPGESATLLATVDASALVAGQNYSANIQFSSNDPLQSAWSLPFLLRVGTTPDPRVLGGGYEILSGDLSPRPEDGTRFAGVWPGSQGGEMTFTLRNLGGGALVPGAAPAVTFSGAAAADFSLVTAPDASVPANGDTSFTVRFSPSRAGARPATVSIATNASGSPYVFAVEGEGLHTFDAWETAHFSAEERALGVLNAPATDADGDGLANLLEYGLGRDPRTADSAPAPSAAVAAGRLALTFTRLRDATDLAYSVEASSDLVAWSAIWSSERVPYEGDAAQSEVTVSDTALLSESARRFLRLRVTRR